MSAMTTTAAKGRHTAQQGFTLIELVIVLAVLGALAAIAVPQLTGLQSNAELQGAATSVSSEANNQFANDLAKGSIDGTQTSKINWLESGDVCASVNTKTSTTVVPTLNDTGFTLADNGGSLGPAEYAVTIPSYDSDNEQVSTTECKISEPAPTN